MGRPHGAARGRSRALFTGSCNARPAMPPGPGGAAPRAAPAVAGVARGRGRVGVGAVQAGVGVEGGLVRVGAAVRERLAPAAPADIPQAGRVLQARRGLWRQRLRAPAPAGLASGGLVRPLARTLGTSVRASPISPAALRSSAAAWTAGTLCPAVHARRGRRALAWPAGVAPALRLRPPRRHVCPGHLRMAALRQAGTPRSARAGPHAPCNSRCCALSGGAAPRTARRSASSSRRSRSAGYPGTPSTAMMPRPSGPNACVAGDPVPKHVHRAGWMCPTYACLRCHRVPAQRARTRSMSWDTSPWEELSRSL